MSHGLYDAQIYHSQIRKEVVQELSHNTNFYAEYIDGNFQQHLINMGKENGSVESWATEAEVIATAYRYNLDIFIQKKISNSLQWIKFPLDHECDHRKEFIAIQNLNDHFDFVRTIERPCNCKTSKEKDTSLEIADIDSDTLDNGLKSKKSSTNNNMGDDEAVINLSSRILSDPEKKLLTKGLKFVPTRRKIDIGKLLADLKTWERRMRLKEYFYTDENNNFDTGEILFKKRSTWTPDKGRDKWLDSYIQEVKDDVIKGLHRDFKMNITSSEEKAMKDLLNDTSIIIRPADKGSGIVVLDSTAYSDGLLQEMNDNSTYKEVPTDLTRKIENKVKKLANDMFKRGSITREMKQYLVNSDVKFGKLQANPKIHKNDVPLRTIVNGGKHPTANMAEIVEHELAEHVRTLPSYIQDTTDFLNKLSSITQPLPPNCIMFCMDVKALYPRVPRKEARESVKEALDNRPVKNIPTDEVLRMMDMVLENNNFSFDGKHYLQTEGTAIGSHLGMNYACTFLGTWEKSLFEKSEKTPLAYFRFVDDIWGLWIDGIDELQKFHKTANSIHQRIQVDLRHSNNKLEFLDVLTIIDKDILKTDLYAKPTDKHLYLHSQSSHPNYMKTSIPYGLGVRVKRICSEESAYKLQRNEIKKNLSNRGYSGSTVEHELQKVDKLSRSNLLTYRTNKSKTDRVPLVLTYSKGLPHVRQIIKKHMTMLYKSDKMKKVFDKPPILAFRRDKNLKDILVHKKHNSMYFKQPNKCEPCGRNCAICPYVRNTQFFGNYEGKTFGVKNCINCTTANVVYALFCKSCDCFIYVGETSDTLYQRHLLNLSLIRRQKPDPVALHFNSANHSVNDYEIVALEKICGDDIYRQTIENLWIKKLRTYKPHGINTKT